MLGGGVRDTAAGQLERLARQLERTEGAVQEGEAAVAGLAAGRRPEERRELAERAREVAGRRARMEKELRLLEAGGDQLEAEAEEEMGSQLTEDQRRRGEELTRKIQQCSAVQCSK